MRGRNPSRGARRGAIRLSAPRPLNGPAPRACKPACSVPAAQCTSKPSARNPHVKHCSAEREKGGERGIKYGIVGIKYGIEITRVWKK